SVVAVVLDLLLARDRLICLDWRTLFHLAFAQGDVDPPAVPVHITESHRRDEDLSAAQPAGRINHQMANREARIVEVEGVDMSDSTIGRADREAFEVPHASEHRWLRWECPSSWNAVSDNLGEVLMALGNQHYLCHAIAPAGSRALELVL